MAQPQSIASQAQSTFSSRFLLFSVRCWNQHLETICLNTFDPLKAALSLNRTLLILVPVNYRSVFTFIIILSKQACIQTLTKLAVACRIWIIIFSLFLPTVQKLLCCLQFLTWSLSQYLSTMFYLLILIFALCTLNFSGEIHKLAKCLYQIQLIQFQMDLY